jgi:hypothetical protein
MNKVLAAQNTNKQTQEFIDGHFRSSLMNCSFFVSVCGKNLQKGTKK